MINGDFISATQETINNIKRKMNIGLNVIIVVDRWEVSGNSIYGRRSNINDDCGKKCDNSPVWPYSCLGTIGNTNYCTATNTILKGLGLSTSNLPKNLYIIDRPSAPKGNGSSRWDVMHDHRHMISFYSSKNNIGSIFKGSFNFSVYGENLDTGQK
jgi:hypothetical protein